MFSLQYLLVASHHLFVNYRLQHTNVDEDYICIPIITTKVRLTRLHVIVACNGYVFFTSLLRTNLSGRF